MRCASHPARGEATRPGRRASRSSSSARPTSARIRAETSTAGATGGPTSCSHPALPRPRSALGVNPLVDWKLFDVGWPLRLYSGRRHSLHDPTREGVEVSARLPEVDDPPPIVDWPRGVKEEPLRWRAVGVGVIVHLVELFLSNPVELDADADRHPQPLFR